MKVRKGTAREETVSNIFRFFLERENSWT